MSVSFCDDGHYHGGCSKPETFLVEFRVLRGSLGKKKRSLSPISSRRRSRSVKKKEEKKPSKRGGFFFPIKHEKHARDIYTIYKRERHK